MSVLNGKTVPGLEENVPALPAWRVIWNMLRFRPFLWLVDLISVALFRASWQLVPALAMKTFFDMLTSEAQVTFGVWAIVAFFVAAWLAQVLGRYGFYYADVPIFNDMAMLLRKNLLKHILQ